MASWMMHFRIADALLKTGSWRDMPPEAVTAFLSGNVAPDSGVPTPDGRGYTPNKNTSHFMRRFEGVPAGQNPERCDPLWLSDAWLTPALERGDGEAAAFYLGYLCHLITDNAWVRDFIYPAKERFAHLRLVNGKETPEGLDRFYAFLKKDWHDMDFLFLKRNPDLPAYRIFLDTPRLENRFLPFFPADAFEAKRREIREFYRGGIAHVEDREVYISDDEANAFVQQVTSELLSGFPDLFGAMTDLYQALPL